MKLTTHYYRNTIPAITVLFVAGIISSYFFIRRTLQRELDAALVRSRSRIEAYVRTQGRLPEISSFNDQQIRFTPGALTLTPGSSTSRPVIRAGVFSDTMQYIPEQQKKHISRKLTFSLLLNGQPWDVSISQPLEGTRHLTILIAEIAIATIFGTLFLFVLINRRVLSRIWGPFYESLDLIRSFKVDGPVLPGYPDSSIEEFRLMNAHFMKAAENANRDYRNLKEFSENASHELQTPLAIIRSHLDLLMQEGITERQSELMQGVYGAVRRMSRLQESLLLLTKIDNRQFTGVDDVRIDLLLHDKVLQLQELLSARGIVCRLDLDQISVPANRELMDILLNNLFGNAIRHNKAHGEIHAQLETGSLRLSNTGADRALDGSRIFRRFYKDAGHADSNGLGLSIIKQICDATAMQVQYAFAGGWHTFTISW